MGGADTGDSSHMGGDHHMRGWGTQGHSGHTCREVFSSLRVRLGYNVIFWRWGGYITLDIILCPRQYLIAHWDHIFHTKSHPIHFKIFSPQNSKTFYHKAINILKFSHTQLYICVYRALKIESVIHISIVEPWKTDLKSSHQTVFTYQYFSHRCYPKPPFNIDPKLKVGKYTSWDWCCHCNWPCVMSSWQCCWLVRIIAGLLSIFSIPVTPWWPGLAACERVPHSDHLRWNYF